MNFATVILSLLLTALPYESFRKVELPGAVNIVEEVARDGDGMIWFGTTSGLFCYDGYKAASVPGVGRTFCIAPFPDRPPQLALGTEAGLVLMEPRSRQMTFPEGSPGGVRALMSDGDSLWLGTFDGLYSFRQGRFTAHPGSANKIIYSLLDDGDCLYTGTYDGLYRYCKATGEYEQIPLPNPGGRVNRFVNALARDSLAILAGTEDGLFRYNPSTGQTEEVPVCRNSVKTFGRDRSGNLLIGTDNGLYVMGGGTLRHICHEAGREDSIGNDIVWSILCDDEGLVWFGTDGEVCLAEEPMPFVPIREITGSGDGNRFTNILRDGSGRLWLGGTDGLVCLKEGSAVWYKVDNPASRIEHNRIRKIYQDRDGDLWICTDGSIHFLEGDCWRKLNLEDSTGARNANWAYDILQDCKGRMWVATSLGGILIKDKRSLLGGSHIADSTVTLPGGSHGLYAYRLAEDASGDIWCLYYEDGLRKMGGEAPDTAGEIPTYLYCDDAGTVWAGLHGRLMRGDGTVFPLNLDGDVVCIAQVSGQLWVSTTGGCVALDRESGRIQRLEVASMPVYAIYSDGDRVLMGTTDGILAAEAEAFRPGREVRPVRLMGVKAGGEPFKIAGRLCFASDVSHLEFELSNLTFGRRRDRILWKLKGIDSDWNMLPQGSNTISFHNLDYGNYTLLAGVPDASGAAAGILEVDFTIRSPWYLRWWAFLLYALAAAGLAAWIVYYLNMRSRLRYETAEKNHILDSLAQVPMNIAAVDIVEVARRCTDDFAESPLAGRRVTFTTDIAACPISIDEYRVATALENILANAAAYSAGDVEIAVMCKDAGVQISVHDSGDGIPEAELPHVKERFYRGEAARRRCKGAGIGLYLADVYTLRNGGTLDIACNGGTKVTMSFPVAAQQLPGRQKGADEKFLADITAIIEAHLDDHDFNVASLCEQAGLGGKLVYRKIKQLAGSTPVEYLRKIRLRRAADLLRQGSFSISEVMYATGFTNASYFSKCFQAEYGSTPKNYSQGGADV
ncbi:MAG: helix-turn-helix domain-containing protein [Bacteroidales bacterium]|nr:helix-turn-helix domain-containing protein [Bacteroidales bacterium]